MLYFTSSSLGIFIPSSWRGAGPGDPCVCLSGWVSNSLCLQMGVITIQAAVACPLHGLGNSLHSPQQRASGPDLGSHSRAKLAVSALGLGLRPREGPASEPGAAGAREPACVDLAQRLAAEGSRWPSRSTPAGSCLSTSSQAICWFESLLQFCSPGGLCVGGQEVGVGSIPVARRERRVSRVS